MASKLKQLNKQTRLKKHNLATVRSGKIDIPVGILDGTRRRARCPRGQSACAGKSLTECRTGKPVAGKRITIAVRTD